MCEPSAEAPVVASISGSRRGARHHHHHPDLAFAPFIPVVCTAPAAAAFAASQASACPTGSASTAFTPTVAPAVGRHSHHYRRRPCSSQPYSRVSCGEAGPVRPLLFPSVFPTTATAAMASPSLTLRPYVSLSSNATTSSSTTTTMIYEAPPLSHVSDNGDGCNLQQQQQQLQLRNHQPSQTQHQLCQQQRHGFDGAAAPLHSYPSSSASPSLSHTQAHTHTTIDMADISKPRPGVGGPKGPQFGSDSGGGVAVITKPTTKQKTKRKEKTEHEPTWRVLLHNDELHTFDYVTGAIVKVVRTVSRKKAYRITVQAHVSGVATVTTTWKAQAEEYCKGLQMQGLTSSIAPDSSFTH